MPVTTGAAFDLAVGEQVQRVAELERGVAEHEAQVDLLVDRHRRPEPVRLHAHADHDDAGEQRRVGDDLVDHAGHADALEDHRVLRLGDADAPRPPARRAHHGRTGRRRSFSIVADGEVEDVRCAESRCPCPQAAANGEPSAGSTTTSAPHAVASARRPAEKSLAITVRTPLALSMQMTASPTGPQPTTIPTWPLPISLRRTACRPTAIGSVSAARSVDSPFGTAKASDSSTSNCSA